MLISSDLVRKGALRMRALVEDINRCAAKCAAYGGKVVPGGMVEIEDLDSIINEVDRALWVIRTLDNEVYRASEKKAYDALQVSAPGGQVVLAFGALRDVATHRAEVVDPEIGRAIGPTDDGRFIIFPRWKQRRNLPGNVFSTQGGKPQADRIAAYDNQVAGRYVLDTLMDAFAFFDQCDGRLARRTADGQLEGFPLTPLPVAGAGYYRLGPDWPTHEDADRHLLRVAADTVPVGLKRSIVGTIQAGATVCGWTEIDHARRASFTEPVHQIITDIGRGYRYVLDSDGSTVIVDRDRLVTTEGRALMDAVPDVESATDASWMSLQEGVTTHADLYMRQRRGM